MAEIAFAEDRSYGKRGRIIYWSAIKNTSTCEAFTRAGLFPMNTVQVSGNFSGAAVLTLQGKGKYSATWETLKDIWGGLAVFAAAGMMVIKETPAEIKWVIAAGDANTAIVVEMNLNI